jgi:energy-coupling factor transporter ATP-binding protein EcfA2
MRGSNGTGMVSDESESDEDDDQVDDEVDDEVDVPAAVHAAAAAPAAAVTVKVLVQRGDKFYFELKKGKYVALGGKAGLGDNDVMRVLRGVLKKQAGVTEFTCAKGPRKSPGVVIFHVVTKQIPRTQHVIGGAHIIKRTLQQLKASETKCDIFLKVAMKLFVREKKNLISVDADVRAAPPAPAAAPAAAPPAAPPVPAKTNVVDDGEWFVSSEEEVQVVDDAAPATKEAEVVEVVEAFDECT